MPKAVVFGLPHSESEVCFMKSSAIGHKFAVENVLSEDSRPSARWNDLSTITEA